MSERKVLTKYYPADFDPSALKRRKGPKVRNQLQTVTLMAPFNMKCTRCGEYIYKGRKFNARKETPDEKYLSVQIFRFYIRCTRCSAEIVFRTDPKNQDYAVVSGAQRSTEPWRRHDADETDEQRLDRLEAEAAAENEDEDRMEELEAKTLDARREMEVADALDEIRTRNARLERADREGAGIGVALAHPAEEEERLRQEREDEEAARRAFALAKAREEILIGPIPEEEEEGAAVAASSKPAANSVGSGSPASSSAVVTPPTTALETTATTTAAPPPPSFKRQVKKKKDHAALLGIKKKPSLV